MAVTTLATTDAFVKFAATPGRNVLLDFRADWCAPCRMLTPVLESLEAAHPDLLVGTVNVDELPEVAAQFGVDSIPALFLLRDGKVVARAAGYMEQAALERRLGL